jgi:hypothetical protein
MKYIALLVILGLFGISLGNAHAVAITSQQVLATGTQNSTIYQIVQRAFEIVVGISSLLIALLWVPIAIGYFSKDLDRKADAKERTKDALIGTIIFVMAVSGILYGVIHYIIVG